MTDQQEVFVSNVMLPPAVKWAQLATRLMRSCRLQFGWFSCFYLEIRCSSVSWEYSLNSTVYDQMVKTIHFHQAENQSCFIFLLLESWHLGDDRFSPDRNSKQSISQASLKIWLNWYSDKNTTTTTNSKLCYHPSLRGKLAVFLVEMEEKINTKSPQHSFGLGMTVSHYWTRFLYSLQRPERILSVLRSKESLLMTQSYYNLVSWPLSPQTSARIIILILFFWRK